MKNSKRGDRCFHGDGGLFCTEFRRFLNINPSLRSSIFLLPLPPVPEQGIGGERGDTEQDGGAGGSHHLPGGAGGAAVLPSPCLKQTPVVPLSGLQVSHPSTH